MDTMPSVGLTARHDNEFSNRTPVDSNITLWQFLLELLVQGEHPQLIQWTNREGEFKLLDAEAVARLWGQRKAKPHMNYDKLSRALRYYYDKNIIKKVIGQKFVYRFVETNITEPVAYNMSLCRAMSNTSVTAKSDIHPSQVPAAPPPAPPPPAPLTTVTTTTTTTSIVKEEPNKPDHGMSFSISSRDIVIEQKSKWKRHVNSSRYRARFADDATDLLMLSRGRPFEEQFLMKNHWTVEQMFIKRGLNELISLPNVNVLRDVFSSALL
ncbi:unnamed protein product [Haemonchus placei]|uniref:ETS domain-containing protein n=1 Tax=Haemonchus placei TaxID=6290 RepID=A0A0N4W7Q9_HAEPC|nr:unnamed protein product [Haemonchus placei]